MDRETPQREPEPIYRPDTPAQSFSFQLYSWLQPFLFALTVLVLISLFLGRMIGVDGNSMYPTLHDKDMLVLQSLGYTPKNGDVVVLAPITFRHGTPIVKRVIATGGQEVDVDYDTGVVTVDGVALEEDYLGEPMRPVMDQFAGQYPITVPQGRLLSWGTTATPPATPASLISVWWISGASWAGRCGSSCPRGILEGSPNETGQVAEGIPAHQAPLRGQRGVRQRPGLGG